MSSPHRAANETIVDNSINTDDAVHSIPSSIGETEANLSQELSRNERTNDSYRSVRQKQQKKQQQQPVPCKIRTDETAHSPYRRSSSSAATSKSNWNEEGADDKLSATNDSSSNSQLVKSNMIIYYVRQLFCLLIVIVTTYATYQNIPSRQLIPPEVKPFFSAESLVDDWPSGDLFKAQAKVTLSELSFVLFYAPWSADSQHARHTYDFVAKLFNKQAYFAAINCWHPVGECRQQYTKVMSWPVLMAYNQNGVAIPYSGLWTNEALTSFILTLLQPLKRIYQPEDLLDLMHKHDVVMVSYLDMLKHQAFYNIYLQASVKWLERDPNRDVVFAIVTGDTRNVFGIDREPSLRMYLWNDTLEYDSSTWKPSLIVQWLANNMQRASMWVTPPGGKSAHLRPFVNRGPVLILFTPRNLYDRANDAYAMLRQVAFEYNNCQDDDWIKDLSRVYSHQRRREHHQHVKNIQNECEKLFNLEKQHFAECVSVARKSFITLVNSSKFNVADQRSKDPYCSVSPGHVQETQFGDSYSSCRYASQRPYDNYLYSESASVSTTKILTSMLNTDNDPRSPDKIRRIWQNMNCKINQFSELIRSDMFYDVSIEKTSVAVDDDFDVIAGAACKYNRTMSFLAMDSNAYGVYAERLGINLHEMHVKTAAVILDSENIFANEPFLLNLSVQNESSYVLQEPISTRNLIYFVHEFFTNKLNRYLRSNVNGNHSFFFDAFRKYGVNLCKNESSRQQKQKSRAVDGVNEPQSISLREISSNNFEKHVLETNKTVAVLFYSTQCALCTVFTNTLLYVANVLKGLPNLEIVRIDSDKNDLPWQFTMELVPTFIIFNGPNKLESRKFPSNLPVNVKNVIGFILSNLDRPSRIHAMILILKQKNIIAIDDGLAILIHEVTDSISYNLQNWRKLPHKRNNILRRIQMLQQLYLALLRVQSANNLKSVDTLVRNILNLWTGNE